MTGQPVENVPIKQSSCRAAASARLGTVTAGGLHRGRGAGAGNDRAAVAAGSGDEDAQAAVRGVPVITLGRLQAGLRHRQRR